MPEIERRAIDVLSRWGVEVRAKGTSREVAFTRVAEAKHEKADASCGFVAEDEADVPLDVPMKQAGEAMRTARQTLPHELLTKGGEG